MEFTRFNDTPYIDNNIPMNRLNNVWLQQNDYLGQPYSGQVISNIENMRWSVRSPDLCPLGFYLWETIQDFNYN